MSPLPSARAHHGIQLLPRVANAPPWMLKPKDPRIKFVDDSVNTSSVNLRKARLLTDGPETFKEIIDNRTQGLLSYVAKNRQHVCLIRDLFIN